MLPDRSQTAAPQGSAALVLPASAGFFIGEPKDANRIRPHPDRRQQHPADARERL